jgi:AmmeMemoRadiSam system protein A
MSDAYSEASQKILLSTAREAIAARLESRQARWVAVSSDLNEPRGAFVTLHKHGALRGCIGRMKAEVPLFEVVREMAVSAAFEDPRFPPLRLDELKEIDLEISVLSPFMPCKPEDVVPGKHGVYIVRAFRSGVFLPQVAPEQGWEREELLENLCSKAGLESGAYRSAGAQLYLFTAFVFGEKD